MVEFFSALGLSTTFVVFLRDVPAYMNSRYVQDAKNLRLAGTFEDFVSAQAGQRMFNYPTVLRPFEQAAPVKVVPYAPKGEAIERVFLKLLGRSGEAIHKVAFKGLPRRNQSPGSKTILLARQISALLPEEYALKDMRAGQFLFKRLCEEAGFNAKPFVGCDQARAEEIRQTFRNATDDVARRYCQRPWHEVVPPEVMFVRFDPDETHALNIDPHARRIMERVSKARQSLKASALRGAKAQVLALFGR